MATALVPVADGFEEVEAIAAIDVLRRGGVEVVVASIGRSPEVKGAHGIVVKADALFSDVAESAYDAIVLPGGGEGTENLKNSDALLKRLVRQREEGGLLCAICAAPTVLQDAGLLEPGQHVTCYPTCQMEIDCTWVNQPAVSHNGIITGRAPGSAMTFAMVVLQALVGDTAAHKVARGLVFDF